jgi:hypothetical protein
MRIYSVRRFHTSQAVGFATLRLTACLEKLYFHSGNYGLSGFKLSVASMVLFSGKNDFKFTLAHISSGHWFKWFKTFTQILFSKQYNYSTLNSRSGIYIWVRSIQIENPTHPFHSDTNL